MTLTFYDTRDYGTNPYPVVENKQFIFPGGEAHVTLAYSSTDTQIALLTSPTSDDLFKVAMWADACHRNRLKTALLIPYLPGARQDRGAPLSARVYADFINSMKLNRVICLDPHSDVMPALINDLEIVHLDELECWSHKNYFFGREWVGVIAPDAGAIKRAGAVADRLNVPVYQALKHRDFATGKLSGFTCEPLPDEGNLLVVDDICDGGGTFVGLAEATGIPKERIDLWVTHGIFSKGAEKLKNHFENIFTTDTSVDGVARVDKITIISVFYNLVGKI